MTMPIWEKSKASLNGKIAWWLLLVVICTHFCLVYLQSSQPFLNLNEYVQGKAPLPYQYRILMAWVLREGLRVPSLSSLSVHFPVPLRDPSTKNSRAMPRKFCRSWACITG